MSKAVFKEVRELFPEFQRQTGITDLSRDGFTVVADIRPAEKTFTVTFLGGPNMHRVSPENWIIPRNLEFDATRNETLRRHFNCMLTRTDRPVNEYCFREISGYAMLIDPGSKKRIEDYWAVLFRKAIDESGVPHYRRMRTSLGFGLGHQSSQDFLTMRATEITRYLPEAYAGDYGFNVGNSIVTPPPLSPIHDYLVFLFKLMSSERREGYHTSISYRKLLRGDIEESLQKALKLIASNRLSSDEALLHACRPDPLAKYNDMTAQSEPVLEEDEICGYRRPFLLSKRAVNKHGKISDIFYQYSVINGDVFDFGLARELNEKITDELRARYVIGFSDYQRIKSEFDAAIERFRNAQVQVRTGVVQMLRDRAGGQVSAPVPMNSLDVVRCASATQADPWLDDPFKDRCFLLESVLFTPASVILSLSEMRLLQAFMGRTGEYFEDGILLDVYFAKGNRGVVAIPPDDLLKYYYGLRLLRDGKKPEYKAYTAELAKRKAQK